MGRELLKNAIRVQCLAWLAGELEVMQRGETWRQSGHGASVDLSAWDVGLPPVLEGRVDLWLHLGWEGSGERANRTSESDSARNIVMPPEALGVALSGLHPLGLAVPVSGRDGRLSARIPPAIRVSECRQGHKLEVCSPLFFFSLSSRWAGRGCALGNPPICMLQIFAAYGLRPSPEPRHQLVWDTLKLLAGYGVWSLYPAVELSQS